MTPETSVIFAAIAMLIWPIIGIAFVVALIIGAWSASYAVISLWAFAIKQWKKAR
jgi:nitrate reductase NapE component